MTRRRERLSDLVHGDPSRPIEPMADPSRPEPPGPELDWQPVPSGNGRRTALALAIGAAIVIATALLHHWLGAITA